MEGSGTRNKRDKGNREGTHKNKKGFLLLNKPMARGKMLIASGGGSNEKIKRGYCHHRASKKKGELYISQVDKGHANKKGKKENTFPQKGVWMLKNKKEVRGLTDQGGLDYL